MFATILENALLPPVLKSTKKIKIKIKECDELNTNYMVKINSMVSNEKCILNKLLFYEDITFMFVVTNTVGSVAKVYHTKF